MRELGARAELDISISARSLWLCCGELTVGRQHERRETGLEVISYPGRSDGLK